MSCTPVATEGHVSDEEIFDDENYEEDGWYHREVNQYAKMHPECPHSHYDGYLGAELSVFKRRDVFILDTDGNFLAGVEHSNKISPSSIYRWMKLVFAPIDGWVLLRVADHSILHLNNTTPILPGKYTVVSEGMNSGLG